MKRSRIITSAAVIAAAVSAFGVARAMTGGMQKEAADATATTLTWGLDKGTDSPSAATVSTEGMFSVAEFSYGSNLTIVGVRTDGGISTTMFQPIEGNNKVNNDANAVVFTVKPKKGVTFTPSKVSFQASKVGTNGGSFDVEVGTGENTTMLATGVNPQLVKNEPYYTLCQYDISGMTVSDEAMTLKIYLKDIASNKQYAFQNVVISGSVSGTPEEVPSYTLDVSLGTDGAGTVSCNPAGTSFDEGTKITVSATENFGYHLEAWVDEDGKTVSEANPYTFELTANTTLKAVYKHNNVYPINLSIEGGANPNLVQFAPEGKVIDGVHWYEEGTEVKLTTLNNRILTFLAWEDNSTSATRNIVMDGEKNLTATFSATDFIVGWDLYYDQPASERAADYKDETDNAGLLSLRNAAGQTTSWLTRGIGNGQENGKYAARIWKMLADKWYFEVSFSSKGYSDLVFSAAVGDDYNTYSVINAEYSTDGVNYTAFGTFNPPSRGWDSKEFAMPAEAADKDRVYVRFMPDYTSSMVGVASDYDGTSVAEIFVLASKNAAADDVAPVLVGTIPANGSTDASSTGSITLTFDEKIKLGSGDAKLGDEVLTPIVSGKNVVYRYAGLDYDTDYTLTVPAGAITDRNGNAFGGTTVNFRTMARTAPDARLFDAIVAQDGSGDHTTVQAAVDAAPEGRVKPWLIFVKNGQYKEHVDIPKNKPFLHFTGQDRDKTVILDDKLCGGDNALHVSVGATVVVNSNDCMFENITLENSYGHEKQDGPQALALNTTGDRTIFNNVAMLSYQDTWITPSASAYRAYVKNSLIEGAVDFIYNSGDIYFEGDTLLITRKSGGYIVAPSHAADVAWGYVFNNCVITAPGVPSETSVWLGRPWHNFPKTVFLNTRAEVTIPATGWYETMGGLPAIWADWNTVDANGNLLDLSQRRDTYYYMTTDPNDPTKQIRVEGKAKNHLTDEEAAQYTQKNVMAGNDNWQPWLKTEECAAPEPVATATAISWEAVPYAICYVVTYGDEVVDITTATSFDMPADATRTATGYAVQAVNEYGGLSPRANATISTAIASAPVAAAAATAATYNLGGMRVGKQAKGIVIARTTTADGQTMAKKIVR